MPRPTGSDGRPIHLCCDCGDLCDCGSISTHGCAGCSGCEDEANENFEDEIERGYQRDIGASIQKHRG